MTQLPRNMVMDLQCTDARVKFLLRDRDIRHPAAFDAVLHAESIEVVQTGIPMPRMNAIAELGYLPVEGLGAGAILPNQAPRPYPHLEPGPTTPRAIRVRAVLQHSQAPPQPRRESVGRRP
ncbi:hypothetical protein P3T29_006121 [Kitasatospora sp. MAP5-34]|nr:hypothetical protein [Kitasatospora sp. MAP5-34]